jgi:hypothetical protein
MGGSGGGSPGISSSSISDILAAAEERLRQIAAEASHVLFGVEPGDRSSLDGLLAGVDPKGMSFRVISSAQVPIDNDVLWANWVVVFTDNAQSTDFLDHVVEAAIRAKKAGVHVRASPSAKIPSRVTAYRWRSISWADFLALLAT